MIKKYEGFKAERTGGPREILPAGGYVAKILAAKQETYSNGNTVLVISFDISEGEYAGFFKRDWENNPNEDKRWRGNVRINIPKDDGTDSDAWTKRTFNNFAASLEESNLGYSWDWDETKLKGKAIGVLFRNREWEYNGSTGWTTEASNVTSVDAIHEGKFRVPKDRPLKNKPEQGFGAPVFTEAEDAGELPF